MNVESMPTIKLEMEFLKHAIVKHLGAAGSQLGETIAQEIDKAVASYPFESKIKRITHETINNAIEQYFSYGKGGAAIRRAVDEALDAATNEKITDS